MNLIINSVDAVNAKIENLGDDSTDIMDIRIRTFRDDGLITIEIYDEGMGMREEDILACTEPFYTTKKDGTGMGLALTKQYVKENDGQLSIDSVYGEYTCMKLTFKEDQNNETDHMGY